MHSLEPKKRTTFIIFAMSKSHFFLKFAVFVLRTFCFVLANIYPYPKIVVSEGVGSKKNGLGLAGITGVIPC